MPLELNWNHFKCNWYEDRIEFYINGKLHRTVTDKKVLSKMDTEGMWVIFNIWGNEDFDCSESGDINNFLSPMMIRNFKVTKL
jgi:beta-glucanase (GH16 family)